METQTTTATTTRKPAKRESAPRTSSARIPLKAAIKGLKIDPKTARRVLRSRKLAFHDLGNRWELTAAQVAKVKEVLKAYLAD